MRRVLLLSLGGVLALALAGCRSTLRYVELERVDQGTSSGNRGYIYGAVPPEDSETTVSPKKRGVVELEVELSPILEHKKYKAPKTEAVSPKEKKQTHSIQPQGDAPFIATYTVAKGDSLSKIAKHFYGSPNKWRLIYEANKDKIKDPNKLKVGLVLEIPQN